MKPSDAISELQRLPTIDGVPFLPDSEVINFIKDFESKSPREIESLVISFKINALADYAKSTKSISMDDLGLSFATAAIGLYTLSDISTLHQWQRLYYIIETGNAIPAFKGSSTDIDTWIDKTCTCSTLDNLVINATSGDCFLYNSMVLAVRELSLNDEISVGNLTREMLNFVYETESQDINDTTSSISQALQLTALELFSNIERENNVKKNNYAKKKNWDFWILVLGITIALAIVVVIVNSQ